MPNPNVLWICSDQQRRDSLGCYGDRYVRTPNFDRLAEGGMISEQTFFQNSVCAPTRVSFPTGVRAAGDVAEDNRR